MTKEEQERQERWLEAMAALEEERGPLFPSGSGGGPRQEKSAETKSPSTSAASRARARLRFLYRAVVTSGAA